MYFALVLLIVGPIAGGFAGGIYIRTDIANENPDVAVKSLPRPDTNTTRILPRTVGNRKTSQSMRRPRYNLGESDITFYNGSYYWSRPVQPSGLYNRLTKRQDGVKLIPIGSTTSSTTTLQGEFKRGVGMLWYSSAQVAYTLSKPTVERLPSTRFTASYNGELYTAQTYITHDIRFKLLPFPTLYSVPEPGGVQILHQNGSVTNIPYEDVPQTDRLDGQNTYPYKLALLHVRSEAYQYGYLNTLVGHRDQPVIGSVPAADNRQPFTQFTELSEAPTYTVVTEPYGQSTNGVYQVWMFNGQTGEIRVYEPQASSNLLGPSRVAEKIVSANPKLNWGKFEVSEIRPVFRDGDLWYAGTIVTGGQSYSKTAFVEAATGNVVTFKTDGAITAFANGESLQEAKQLDKESGATYSSRPQQSQIDGTTITIIVTSENGTVVKNFTLRDGQSITIKNEDNTNSTESMDQD